MFQLIFLGSACNTNYFHYLTTFSATMVWLVNMADTDRPKRNSTEAASPQQEAQGGEQSVKVLVIE